MVEPGDVGVPAEARRGALGRVLSRLVSSDSELESAALQRDVLACGATPLGHCGDREQVVASGTVAALTVQPRGTSRWLAVDLKDGSGHLTLLWMGRRSIPGVEPGARLKVSGRITRHEGERVMFNPRYQLLPPSHQG